MRHQEVYLRSRHQRGPTSNGQAWHCHLSAAGVDHSCPIGLHWEVSPLELSRPNIKAEMHEWTSSFPPDKYEVSLTDTYIKIGAQILTDVPVLLTWAPKYPSAFTSLLTLIYSTGPWTKDNLVTAVEFFFQRNAHHPFAQCMVVRFHLPRFY